MADNLWSLREQKKLSVAALANRAGLPIGLIMEYESGQRSIDPRHLSRLARALYVEDSDIRLQSDPRPGAQPLERQAAPSSARYGPSPEPVAANRAPGATQAPPRPRERPMRGRNEHRPPSPPRPSQLSHFNDVLVRLGRTQAEVEAALGKPIEALDRQAMSELLKTLQEEVRRTSVERHRAYLPEGVDAYESRYLTRLVNSGAPVRFSLFDGSETEGTVIGYGPYSITLRRGDDTEITLNKLGIVSYATLASNGPNQGKPT